MTTTNPQPVKLADDLERAKHAEALSKLIEGEIRFGAHDRMLYATDASLYQVEPIGVVIPKMHEDLEATVRYCAEHRLPMLPRGGGTSLAGQCVNRAIVIDVSVHLNSLSWVDVENRSCSVESGITIDDLNDQLREHGLFFAPDPSTASRANIGGCIGNNAAGTRSIKYGRTSENLEGITVLLVNGEQTTFSTGSALKDDRVARVARGVIDIVDRHEKLIRERFPKTIRRNAGYALDMILAQLDEARANGRDPLESLDLTPLICGSEGTLAIVTDATLKLEPLPKARGLAVIGFDSLDEAIELVEILLTLDPSAVELLDDLVFDMARRNREHAPSVDLMPQPTASISGNPPKLRAALYVEFFTDCGIEDIQNKFHNLRNVVAMNASGAGVATYTDASAMDRALALRKAGEPLLHAIPGARKPITFVEDNAVPVEKLPEFVRRFREIVESKGTRASFWAHASVGVLHVRPLLSLRSEQDKKLMEEIAVEVADLAQELGGVMSGEHGDGKARGPLLERFYGPQLMDAFREIKQLFDPNNLLNPGNIVAPGPIESIHESTRVRPHGHDLSTTSVETYFDYADDEGFDHAVELCNGSGVCRKKQGGTMCPSYMATLDERHSTRGRGNALRLAITGQLRPPLPLGSSGAGVPPASKAPCVPTWNDPETLATLDLCLSCKACKTECPTNVDIARYKAEYLAQSYKATGKIPFQVRTFSDVRRLNKWGSRFAPLSNLVANSWPARAIANQLLDLHPDRSLPPFAPSLFRQIRGSLSLGERGKRINAALPDNAPTVILFADCFTAYSETNIGIATIRVLNAFGYRVELTDAGCCGRPHISTGNLDAAQRVIARTSQNLSGAIARTNATAIIVCEPSCLSAITDDWGKLGPLAPSLSSSGAGVPPAFSFPSLSTLPESFLASHWASHPRAPTFRSPKGKLFLHAHCHQKALWGAESSGDFLRHLAPASDIDILDSGCCGMAGSFGFTRGHYDLSMKIGELSLFPAARKLAPDDQLVAPGTSCRHQLLDGVNVTALHPMEIAANLLSL